MILRAQIAGTSRRGEVVDGLVVASGVEHGAGAVASAAHLHRVVFLLDFLSVESKQRIDRCAKALIF